MMKKKSLYLFIEIIKHSVTMSNTSKILSYVSEFSCVQYHKLLWMHRLYLISKATCSSSQRVECSSLLSGLKLHILTLYLPR